MCCFDLYDIYVSEHPKHYEVCCFDLSDIYVSERFVMKCVEELRGRGPRGMLACLGQYMYAVWNNQRLIYFEYIKILLDI